MYFNFDLNFNMTLSSADNHFKQLGSQFSHLEIIELPNRGKFLSLF